MKILVTGGTGLVGSYLLLNLCAKGIGEIRATYRNSDKIKTVKKLFERENQLQLFDQIEWVQADINDQNSLDSLFSGVDQVYHSAAIVSFKDGDYSKLMETNTMSTATIVNLCIEHNVKKLCYVSSVSALGSYLDKKCIDEAALWQKTSNTSAYSISKFYGENEVWRGSEEGLDMVIVNPVTILGYGDWNESSLKIIKRIASGLKYYTSGSNGFIGANDVAKTMCFLMDSNIKNERFVLVSENLTFKSLFSMIASELKVNEPKKLLPKRFAFLFMKIEQLRAFFGGNPIVNPSTLETAYKDKCYNSNKINGIIPFRFQPIKEVLRKSLN